MSDEATRHHLELNVLLVSRMRLAVSQAATALGALIQGDLVRLIDLFFRWGFSITKRTFAFLAPRFPLSLLLAFTLTRERRGLALRLAQLGFQTRQSRFQRRDLALR